MRGWHCWVSAAAAAEENWREGRGTTPAAGSLQDSECLGTRWEHPSSFTFTLARKSEISFHMKCEVKVKEESEVDFIAVAIIPCVKSRGLWLRLGALPMAPRYRFIDGTI